MIVSCEIFLFLQLTSQRSPVSAWIYILSLPPKSSPYIKGLFFLPVGFLEHLQDCWSFLRRHASLLSSYPPLFIQQAFNEPPETSAHRWARGLVGTGGVRVVEWLNNKDQTGQETR